jgi:hypothetical protein
MLKLSAIRIWRMQPHVTLAVINIVAALIIMVVSLPLGQQGKS